MSARLERIAGRRRALVDDSDRNRAALAALTGEMERKLALAETVIASVRRVQRHRVLFGAAAAFLVFAPRATRSMIGRGAWLAILASEAVRLGRNLSGPRRGDA